MNKLKITINRLALIFLSGIFSSCSDVLDKVPLTSYSDATVWEDQALIDAYISNTYRVIPVGWNVLSCLCDENVRRNNAAYNTINEGNLTPSNCNPVNFWSNYYDSGIDRSTGGLYPGGYYAVIKRCNNFFENIETADLDEAVKKRMTGETKFFRGYSCFRLATIYNGVPLITATFDLDDDFDLPRNSYEECMDFALQELDEAIALLPLTYDDGNTGRITKGAAMAAKARALLYRASPLNNPSNDRSKWRQAADAAKAVIDLNLYALYAGGYKESYMASALYNEEVIWARLYNNQLYLEFNVEQSHMPNGYYGFAQIHPTQNMVDEYEMTSGLLPREDPSYDPQNPYVNRDPRFYDCILYDGALFQGREAETFLPGGKDSKEGSVASWNATTTGYYARKFIDESIIVPSSTNVGNTPWPFFRYNEVLLNYAEANFYLGDEATCREYINMIRSRPGVEMPPVTASGDALLEKLRHERKIELYFEEHRWFDVRRWKIAPQALSVPARKVDIVENLTTGEKTYTYTDFQQRSFPDKMYYMPVPQSEIDKDKNLEQNPGY